MKHIISVILILFIISTFLNVSSYQDEVTTNHFSYDNILYVGGSGPGNYTKIQDAIDYSSDGDTIFVYSGEYIENLIIDKSINLIGENRHNTIINGSFLADVICIIGNAVNISGFTIKNSRLNLTYAGINITSNYCTIKNNLIFNNDAGIQIDNSQNNIISNNNVSLNNYGIWFFGQSNSNSLQYNTITKNKWYGIRLEQSQFNNLKSNEILDNGNGAIIKDSENNKFLNNSISGNWYGLEFYNSSNSTINNNIFSNDDLYIFNSFKNTVTNNTINGKQIVYFEEKSDKIINYTTGQIILINCINISIKNQEFSGMVHGIELWGSKSSNISNNIIKTMILVLF